MRNEIRVQVHHLKDLIGKRMGFVCIDAVPKTSKSCCQTDNKLASKSTGTQNSRREHRGVGRERLMTALTKGLVSRPGPADRGLAADRFLSGRLMVQKFS